MRIAVISDIHGNEVALHNVLTDIGKAGADKIVCLGDVATLGPSPVPVVRTLREMDCTFIMGNHDEFLIDPESELIHQYIKVPLVLDAVDWCREELDREDLYFLETFQSRLEITIDEQTDIILYHGSPRSHVDDILATTLPSELDEMLGGNSATVMIGGHTHIQMVRKHRGALMVNPGSVGFPFKSYMAGQHPEVMRYAEYAMVDAAEGEINISLKRLPQEKSDLYEAVYASSCPLREILLQQYS